MLLTHNKDHCVYTDCNRVDFRTVIQLCLVNTPTSPVFAHRCGHRTMAPSSDHHTYMLEYVR